MLVCVIVIKVLSTAKVIWRWGYVLKSHLIDWRSRGLNLQTLVYKVYPYPASIFVLKNVVCLLFLLYILRGTLEHGMEANCETLSLGSSLIWVHIVNIKGHTVFNRVYI